MLSAPRKRGSRSRPRDFRHGRCPRRQRWRSCLLCRRRRSRRRNERRRQKERGCWTKGVVSMLASAGELEISVFLFVVFLQGYRHLCRSCSLSCSLYFSLSLSLLMPWRLFFFNSRYIVSQKWRAQININGSPKYLGSFDNEVKCVNCWGVLVSATKSHDPCLHCRHKAFPLF